MATSIDDQLKNLRSHLHFNQRHLEACWVASLKDTISTLETLIELRELILAQCGRGEGAEEDAVDHVGNTLADLFNIKTT